MVETLLRPSTISTRELDIPRDDPYAGHPGQLPVLAGYRRILAEAEEGREKRIAESSRRISQRPPIINFGEIQSA